MAATLSAAFALLLVNLSAPTLAWPKLACFGFLVAGLAAAVLAGLLLHCQLLRPLLGLETDNGYG